MCLTNPARPVVSTRALTRSIAVPWIWSRKMSASNFVYEGTVGAPLKMWKRGVPVEESALQQLRNVASLPFIHHHVAAMPDVHWGMGATVGSVIATQGAIVPAAVGVDIGCGMIAQRTTLTANDLPD